MRPFPFASLALLVTVFAAPHRAQGRAAVPLAPQQDSNWLAAASAEVERAEYHFNPLRDEPEVWSAPNRAHGFRSRVSAHGLEVFPRTTSADGVGAPWTLRLRTTSFGRTDGAFELPPATLTPSGARVELDHGHAVEWFENTSQGLEQGWTIPARPPGAGELWLGLELAGDLSLRIDDGARSAVLVDPCGEVVLRYRNLHVFDATGRELPAHLHSNLSGFGIAVNDAGASYPLTVDPVLTGPSWTVESGQAGAQLGFSVAPAGDVNGDGFSDVMLGLPKLDLAFEDEGAVYVFLGSNTGLEPTSSAWFVRGGQRGCEFGTSVSAAGDVNGDGFGDVIVGAPRFTTGPIWYSEGAAFIYLGSAAGLSRTPSWTYRVQQDGSGFGSSVASAGDTNGDGYSDVIVGAPGLDILMDNNEGAAFVFFGCAQVINTSASWITFGSQTNEGMGMAVAGIGDTDGDGYDDIALGAYPYDNLPVGRVNVGRVLAFNGTIYGPSPSPTWAAEGEQTDGRFAWSISTAGDVNNDGFDDLLVGAPFSTNGEPSEGLAWLYLGTSTGLQSEAAWTAESNQPFAQFGYSLCSAGDVNGDGYSDVAIGAPAFDAALPNDGNVFLYLGSAEGLGVEPDWTIHGVQPSYFGFSVATAGDTNGDGFSDLIVGAPYYSNGQPSEGCAYLYNGSATGLQSTEAWTTESNQASSLYGFSVATAGDVNGDGFSDTIVGAPYFDNGRLNEGRAFVYQGSASGPSPVADWTTESNQTGGLLGFAVSSAGDVNGDGYADVLVGAPRYDNVEANEGRVFVHLGSATGLDPNPIWSAEPNQANAEFGSALASAGDVNGDGFSDVIVGALYHDGGQMDEGGAWVYLGSASGPELAPAWSAEPDQQFARFGHAVGSAGDVNGDGFSDVVVGAIYHDGGQLDEGRAYVYLGSPNGLAPAPAWTAEPDQAGASFGSAVATAGDVNGDGFSDLIVGAYTYEDGEANEGRAFVYLGSATGLGLAAAWTAEADQAHALFGNAVGTAGDVNGDGYSDVLIGIPNFDDVRTNGGRVEVYLGSATGLASAPGWTAQGDSDFAYFGQAASTAGDVNGDGYSDVIVGAFGHANPDVDEGAAYVYLGNEGAGGLVRTLQQRTKSGNRPLSVVGAIGRDGLFRIRCEFPRNAAGFAWASPAAPEAWLEWEVKPLGVAFDGTDVQAGTPQALGSSGGTLTFDELVAVPDTVRGHARTAPQSFHWRARVATNNPLFPNTAWFSVQGSNVTEAKLRKPWRR